MTELPDGGFTSSLSEADLLMLFAKRNPITRPNNRPPVPNKILSLCILCQRDPDRLEKLIGAFASDEREDVVIQDRLDYFTGLNILQDQLTLAHFLYRDPETKVEDPGIGALVKLKLVSEFYCRCEKRSDKQRNMVSLAR